MPERSAASLLVRLRFAVRYVLSPTAPLSPRERQFVAQIRRLQRGIADLRGDTPEATR